MYASSDLKELLSRFLQRGLPEDRRVLEAVAQGRDLEEIVTSLQAPVLAQVSDLHPDKVESWYDPEGTEVVSIESYRTLYSKYREEPEVQTKAIELLTEWRLSMGYEDRQTQRIDAVLDEANLLRDRKLLDKDTAP